MPVFFNQYPATNYCAMLRGTWISLRYAVELERNRERAVFVGGVAASASCVEQVKEGTRSNLSLTEHA